MKDVFGTGLSGLTRRQFVEKSGWLVAAALIRPAGSLAQDAPKSGAEERAEEKNPLEISPLEDLTREHGVLARILLIYDEAKKTGDYSGFGRSLQNSGQRGETVILVVRKRRADTS